MYRVHVNHSVIGIPGFGDCVSLVLVTVPVTTYVLRQVPGKGCPDHARVAGFRTVPREADPPNLPSSVIISANLQSFVHRGRRERWLDISVARICVGQGP